jgi:hypothetical protein
VPHGTPHIHAVGTSVAQQKRGERLPERGEERHAPGLYGFHYAEHPQPPLASKL